MPPPPAHVVLVSPGAKVGLAKAFREATIRQRARLSAWESDPWSPAARVCTTIGPGGPIVTEAAAGTLLAWCIRHRVGLVVPTRHDDLPTLARAREFFERAGVGVAVSSSPCVDLCAHKGRLADWLSKNEFPAPRRLIPAVVRDSDVACTFPLIAKHVHGSGSRMVRRLERPDDVSDLSSDWIIQELAPGTEFTINTYVDREGRCLCEVPHERLLVSEGEVLRARTRRIPALMELGRRISETLPQARGPLNIQVFWNENAEEARVTDVNPRFGGGYPLAHQAGGRFSAWLLEEHLHGRSLAPHDDWEDGLLMVRYREAAFFRAH